MSIVQCLAPNISQSGVEKISSDTMAASQTLNMCGLNNIQQVIMAVAVRSRHVNPCGHIMHAHSFTAYGGRTSILPLLKRARKWVNPGVRGLCPLTSPTLRRAAVHPNARKEHVVQRSINCQLHVCPCQRGFWSGKVKSGQQ